MDIFVEQVKLRKAKDQLFLNQKKESSKMWCKHYDTRKETTTHIDHSSEHGEIIEVEVEICNKCGLTINDI